MQQIGVHQVAGATAALKTWMRLSATLTLFLSEWATDTECLQGDEHEAEEEETEEEEEWHEEDEEEEHEKEEAEDE